MSYWQIFSTLFRKKEAPVQPVGVWTQFIRYTSRFGTMAFDTLSDHAEILVIIAVSWFAFNQLQKLLDPNKDASKSGNAKAQEIVKKLASSAPHKLTDLSLNSYESILANDLILPGEISVTLDDIGGIDNIKEQVKELLLLPLQYPHLFPKGQLLSGIPRGILLYGPPGTGKTMLAKAIAKGGQFAFLNLNIANICSKWFGESEKFVEATFTLAQKLQPCIIFIDEIDSMLRKRSSQEHEVSTRVKSLFMTLWDGLLSDDSQIAIIGATNRPRELDDAILRRMPQSFLISLPNREQRLSILKIMLKNERIDPLIDLGQIATVTEGFSGSDLKALCQEAARGPIREFAKRSHQNNNFNLNNNNLTTRLINIHDFQNARQIIGPSGESANNYNHNNNNNFDEIPNLIPILASLLGNNNNNNNSSRRRQNRTQ